MKRKESSPQPTCSNCGGLHFGSPVGYCPFTKAPCVICGEQTIYACSDCRIDTQKTIHICEKSSCKDAHENRVHAPAAPDAPQGEGTR